VKEINTLDERKKGKKPLPDEAAANQAAEAILVKYRVKGLVKVSVSTEIKQQEKRRYGARPAGTVRTERVQVRATIDKAAVKKAVRRLGWRVYATNHTADELSLAQAVAAYRSEYLIEQGFRVGDPVKTHKSGHRRSPLFSSPISPILDRLPNRGQFSAQVCDVIG
jgi:transposase